MRIKYQIGDKINSLKIDKLIKEFESGQYHTIAYCTCICGKSYRSRLTRLVQEIQKDCGCSKMEGRRKKCIEMFTTHGLHDHKLYNAYHHIKDRCYNKKSHLYQWYGKRGISVCQEWLDDFMNFYNWAILHGWKEGLTIERKNVNGHYCPENCEWIPKSQQNKNRTDSILLKAFGESKILADWHRDDRCEVDYKTFWERIKDGENPEIAMKSRRKR